MTVTGEFLDVAGLTYCCSDLTGETTPDFKYQYRPDVAVIFSIGTLEIGRCYGKPTLTISDLVPQKTSIVDPRLLNRARLLYSLTSALGFEKPIVIDEKTRQVVDRYASQIDLDASDPGNLTDVLCAIGKDLNIIPKTLAHTKNHLRRDAAGFKVLRDIHISVRDGAHVIGDVYLPVNKTATSNSQLKYPVLVSCTIYGKRVVYSGPDVNNPDKVAAFEEAENNWHTTTAEAPLFVPNTGSYAGTWTCQRGFETIGMFNTYGYVPRGYAMVKIDPRGIAQTPGKRGVPGQLSTDLYDAIEWAAQQPWSNGNIAMVGNSYGANVQWPVAAMKPRGLKCFVPYATDLDFYREVAYTGGVPSMRWLSSWYGGVQAASPKWTDHFDFIDKVRSEPFWNEFWESIDCPPEEADIPCFVAAAQMLIVHGRGPFEAWRRRKPNTTWLQMVDSNYYHWPNQIVVDKIAQFLDYHLKGVGILTLERVGIQMRLGNGDFYWRKETDWPVPGTQYQKFYLLGNGILSSEFQREAEQRLAYSTTLPEKGTRAGISFQTSPFETDMEFAGHLTANLSVSSSAGDADFVVTLWAIDEWDNVVPFGEKGKMEPLAIGWLRASHRKSHPSRSTPERPVYTHTQEDNAPLGPGEVVQLSIEIYPASGRLHEGWRLRVDITPTDDQPEILSYDPLKLWTFYSESHEEEAINAVHFGGDHVNFVAIPIIPLRESVLDDVKNKVI